MLVKEWREDFLKPPIMDLRSGHTGLLHEVAIGRNNAQVKVDQQYRRRNAVEKHRVELLESAHRKFVRRRVSHCSVLSVLHAKAIDRRQNRGKMVRGPRPCQQQAHLASIAKPVKGIHESLTVLALSQKMHGE